jgi:hypothetical protein
LHFSTHTACHCQLTPSREKICTEIFIHVWNQQMHIQLYMFFIINAYLFRSPSATIFRMYSITVRSTTELIYGEILQDLFHYKNAI